MERVLLRGFKEVQTHMEIRLIFLHLATSKRIFWHLISKSVCRGRCEGFAERPDLMDTTIDDDSGVLMCI